MAVEIVNGEVPFFYVDPALPVRPNGVVDWGFYQDLVRSMTRDGWNGPPLVVLIRDDYHPPAPPLAFTGSHRLAAAEQVGIQAPCVDLPALFAARGKDFETLLDAWLPPLPGAVYSDHALYLAVARLIEQMPIWEARRYDITFNFCRGTTPASDGHQHLCHLEPEHELDDDGELHECVICDTRYAATSW
jgi:hypothetical protein